MNTSTACHGPYPEDLLERYAMRNLSDVESGPLEEHLLLCPACQQRLQDMDEFLAAAKAALALLDSSAEDAVSADPSKRQDNSQAGADSRS
jgi:anti-sigma factor RsiW